MLAERALVQSCCDRFDAEGLEDYLALYAEDAVLWGYGPEPIRGKAGIRAFYQGILATFSDIRLVLDDVLADPERNCLTLRFHMDCRQTGPFMGYPASGRSGRLEGLTILRFEGGRCVERWSTADFMGLLAQLGALPAS